MLFISKAKAYKKTLKSVKNSKKSSWKTMIKFTEKTIKCAIKKQKFHTQIFFDDPIMLNFIVDLKIYLTNRGYDVKRIYHSDEEELSISWDKE